MPENDIFLTKFNDPFRGGGHQQFADLFRLYMLKKQILSGLTPTWFV